MKKLLFSIFAFSSFPLSGMYDKLVDRDTFFKHVMGISEPEFQKSDKHLAFIEWQEEKRVYFLKKIKEEMAEEKFCAGKFSVLSVKELREKTNNIQKSKGIFNVIEALSPLGTSYYKYVDIGANQADPKNRDAVFQVASNFNALELLSSGDNMENITKYISDATQGPFASISAAPGTILRHYYMFYNPNTDQKEWQQYAIRWKLWQKSDAKKQLNLLENTEIPVVNSYVAFAERAPKNIKNFAVEDIKVGWHEAIQVTSGLMPNIKQHTQINDPDQIINQVFTAAVDFGSNSAYQEDEKAIEIAQAILDAAYEGTIRAAAAHGKKRVYLSLIGGGVFRNKLAWIAIAIEKMKQFISESGLDVTLIIFDGNDKRLAEQIDEFRNHMKQLVAATGGEYMQYAQDYPQGKKLVVKDENQKFEVQNKIIESLQIFSNSLLQLKKSILLL